LSFVLLLAALPLACTGGITGLGPSCFELDQEDFPTGEGCNPVLASHGQPAKELAFRGGGTLLTTRQDFAPEFPAARSTFGGRCTVPSDWVIEFTGTARITRFGKSEVVFEHCSQADFATGNATYQDGMLAVTAANGDVLWGTYGNGTAAFVSPTAVAWKDDFILTGGTGRFAGASGSGLDQGTSYMDTGITEWEMEGVIAYDASNR